MHISLLHGLSHFMNLVPMYALPKLQFCPMIRLYSIEPLPTCCFHSGVIIRSSILATYTAEHLHFSVPGSGSSGAVWILELVPN